MTASERAERIRHVVVGGGWRLGITAGLLIIAVVAAQTAGGAYGLPFLACTGHLACVTPDLVRIDVSEHRLPNPLVLPGYVVLCISTAWFWLQSGVFPMVAVCAGALCGLFFLMMHLLGGLGMGDVKLVVLLGFALGLVGDISGRVSPPGLGGTPALIGVLAMFLIGGAAGVVVMLRRSGSRRTRIPFGPFMLVGFWTTTVLVATGAL
ncbi:hypothetical protein GCM10027416_10810 [Okibacterium endophyticum]